MSTIFVTSQCGPLPHLPTAQRMRFVAVAVGPFEQLRYGMSLLATAAQMFAGRGFYLSYCLASQSLSGEPRSQRNQRAPASHWASVGAKKAVPMRRNAWGAM